MLVHLEERPGTLQNIDSKREYGGNRKYEVKGKKGCDSKHIDDKILYQVFISTFNAMIENTDYFMEKWKKNLESDNILVR